MRMLMILLFQQITKLISSYVTLKKYWKFWLIMYMYSYRDFPVLRFSNITQVNSVFFRKSRIAQQEKIFGGWGGIRTHGTLARTPVFKTGAFNHSATHPNIYFQYRKRFLFVK